MRTMDTFTVFSHSHFSLIIQAFKQQIFSGHNKAIKAHLNTIYRTLLLALALGSRKTNSQATNIVFMSERPTNTVSAHNQTKQSRL